MKAGSPRWLSIAGSLLALVVVTTIAVALYIAGSPLEARKGKADQARAERLESLYQSVRSFYDNEGHLPKDFGDLSERPQYNIDIAKDPVTGSLLHYRVVNPFRFEICADFETDTTSDKTSWSQGGRNFNRHAEGRVCFEFSAKGSNK